MSATKYTIGLDYGTNSVRTLIVNVANGREVASAVWNYEHGTQGVILSRDPNLARQHPADYVTGAEITIKKALGLAKRTVRGFAPDQIIGIGVDTTGSTPLPVDRHGRPLAFDRRFAKHPAAMAWLWKDHTGDGRGGGDHRAGAQDSAAIPRQVRRHVFQRMVLQQDPPLPADQPRGVRRGLPVGGMLRLGARDAHRHRGARTKLTIGVCAAGHKAMYQRRLGRLPGCRVPGAA